MFLPTARKLLLARLAEVEQCRLRLMAQDAKGLREQAAQHADRIKLDLIIRDIERELETIDNI